MAKACAFKGCGARKAHPIHGQYAQDYHPFMDRAPVGLQPISAARRAYTASQEHQEAYGVAEAYCVGHALDAPGKCAGPLTPHHTLKRSYAGTRYAEANAPVVTLCAWLNGAIESDAEVRAWALRARFTRNGVEYPFLVDKVSHDRERNLSQSELDRKDSDLALRGNQHIAPDTADVRESAHAESAAPTAAPPSRRPKLR